MKILLLGGGGREHAIAKSILKSDKCEKLYVMPGNAGTGNIAINIQGSVNDFNAIADIISHHEIDMLIVGPEEPLVLGIYDFMKSKPELKNLKIIGPDKVGAQLEGSKAWSKTFMQKRDIPTARYRSFSSHQLSEASEFIDGFTGPVVLKADGLAAGKGVIITSDKKEAKEVIQSMFEGQFGAAGSTVVVEEFLDGIEFSVFALTDGHDYILLPEAKDYKRIGEKDTGLNTGGMGAVSPVSFFDDDMKSKVISQIIQPTIIGLQEEGAKYVGFIFFGLIKVQGEPFVIEYNCRLGDPETEVVVPRIQSDLLELFDAACTGQLASKHISIDPRTAVTTMAVAGGYPGDYKKGHEILIPEDSDDNCFFHAGTKDINGKILTNGGRVIAATALADDLPTAIRTSQSMVSEIKFQDKYFRTDIGSDLVKLNN